MSPVLNLILSHQSAPAIAKMISYWGDYAEKESILLAYGGTEEEFSLIEHSRKIFIPDAKLRTTDHQREFQSYTQIFRGVAAFLRDQASEFSYVHFAEYDHLPLIRDLNERQVKMLEWESADVLGFHLHRIDGTSNPHFLYHLHNPDFISYWQRMSCRSEKNIVLSMFGSGSFWTKEAFCAVGNEDEPFPIYLEVYLPTLAHHLGYRVRNFGAQERFIGVLEDQTRNIDAMRQQGGWSLHPVKDLWTK